MAYKISQSSSVFETDLHSNTSVHETPKILLKFQVKKQYFICNNLITYLNSNHHVQMSLAILFDYIAHVVRFPCLLEFSPGHEVLDLPNRPNGVSMYFR